MIPSNVIQTVLLIVLKDIILVSQSVIDVVQSVLHVRLMIIAKHANLVTIYLTHNVCKTVEMEKEMIMNSAMMEIQ
jgi:DNA polymerase III psi subunit